MALLINNSPDGNFDQEFVCQVQFLGLTCDRLCLRALIINSVVGLGVSGPSFTH